MLFCNISRLRYGLLHVRKGAVLVPSACTLVRDVSEIAPLRPTISQLSTTRISQYKHDIPSPSFSYSIYSYPCFTSRKRRGNEHQGSIIPGRLLLSHTTLLTLSHGSYCSFLSVCLLFFSFLFCTTSFLPTSQLLHSTKYLPHSTFFTFHPYSHAYRTVLSLHVRHTHDTSSTIHDVT